jgi:hypothetical protein
MQKYEKLWKVINLLVKIFKKESNNLEEKRKLLIFAARKETISSR